MLEFLKNKHTSKAIIDDGLRKYFEERKFEISQELEIFKRAKTLIMNEELMDLRIRCAVEIGKGEHEYHYAKELKGIELAKLDAQIDAKKDILGAVLAEKDKTIETLKEALKAVTNNTRANY